MDRGARRRRRPGEPGDYTAGALLDDQVRHRGMRIQMTHETLGPIAGLRYPVRMSGSPVENDTAPPSFGEDTHDVLAGLLGLDEATISELAEKKVI